MVAALVEEGKRTNHERRRNKKDRMNIEENVKKYAIQK
jgi:hypothetical protein